MKIKTVQIGEFLKSLNEAEYQFLKLTMNVVEGLKSLREEYQMSKDAICTSFDIKEDAYDNFVKGNYEYRISHLATINHLIFNNRMEDMKDNPKFKITE